MPTGIPKKGYRRTKKLETPSLQEVEKRLALRVPELIEKLEELTKPILCPNCGIHIRTPDREAIVYLIDRAMGKPVQKHELDVTETIRLDADQIDTILLRILSSPQAIEYFRLRLPEGDTIEGEYKVL